MKIKKLTQRDRYGNQITYEYEVPPALDQNKLLEKAMDMEVPPMIDNMPTPDMGHPGQPKGSDTVPAWLTPGEFVVNKEAMEIPGNAEVVKNINEQGREMQQGGAVHMQQGGNVFMQSLFQIPDPMERYNMMKQAVDWTNKNPQQGSTLDNLADYVNKNYKPKSKETKKETKAAKKQAPVPTPVVPVEAPRSKASGTWNIPLGNLGGIDWSTQGHYADMDKGEDAWGAGLTGTLRFEEGGDVPKKKKKSVWDYVWKNDNLKDKKGRWKNVKHKADGGWINDDLLNKLRLVESGGRNDVTSRAGAVGEYQWLPKSAASPGFGVKPFDPKDPKAARAATADYLRGMQSHYGFTPEETLRAYNWGPTNVVNYNKGKRTDIPAEALNYPGKILGVENIQGVPVHGEAPVPKMRPGGVPLPKMRPDNFVPVPKLRPDYKASGGEPYQDRIMGMVPEQTNEVPSNVVPALTDVPQGHVMFGGNQNLGGETVGNDIVEENAMAEDQSNPWWSSLLGAKSKEALGHQLDDKDKEFLDKKTAENEKLASPEIAEEENNIATEYSAALESVEDEIIKDSGTTENKGDGTQVDDFSPKGNKADKKKVTEKILEGLNKGDKDNTNTDPSKDNKSDAEVVDAAKNVSENEVNNAAGFLKGVFGDLFDKKELARMAVMYLGSRAMGYNHGGSLQFAAKSYLGRVDKKAAARDKFVTDNVGKFTSSSLEEYRKTGNVTSLVKEGVPLEQTGQSKVFYDGKNVVNAVQVKQGKNTYWMNPATNKPLNLSKYVEDKSRVPGSKEYFDRINTESKFYAEPIKIFREENKKGTGDDTKFATDLNPVNAGRQVSMWANKHNIKPENMQQIIEQSLEDMKAFKQEDYSRKVDDITPFLNARFVANFTGNSSLFEQEGKMMNTQKISRFIDDAANILKTQFPKKYTSNTPNNTIANEMFATLQKQWGQLDAKAKERYENQSDDESPFFTFANDQLAQFVAK